MTTLLRGISKESAKTSQLLEKSNIKFREVFCDEDKKPTLIGCIYSYKGYSDIERYVKGIVILKDMLS